MGIYLNPNNKSFRDSLRSEIYVDKTGLIAYTNKCLNTRDKYICVSRPRRFGKSMALEMLAAYYSRGCDSKKLFRGLKIENEDTYAKYLNQFDVIYLNMQQFFIEAAPTEAIPYLEREALEELNEEYGDILKGRKTGLAGALRRIYAKTEREFIVLIDEWDCVMRERRESEGLQKQYLDFLRSLLKDQPYIALAYMTGILPVKKYGIHSALNMFQEFSMTDQKTLEEYTGFTEAEVKGLCSRYGMDYGEAKSWYDGYRFLEHAHIYNPKSVVEAMRCGHFSSYWTSTETYDALKIFMEMDFDGLRQDILRMVCGMRASVNTRSFQNDMKNFRTKDDILTLFIHLGYLGYDARTQEAFIPNREVLQEFETAIGNSPVKRKAVSKSFGRLRRRYFAGRNKL